MQRRCLNCFRLFNVVYKDVNENEVCPHCGYYEGTAPMEPYHLVPGATLYNGRYVIGTVIGYGGFGSIYKAWDNVLDTVVAVKEYYPAGLVQRVPGQKHVIVYTGDSKKEYMDNLDRFLEEAKDMSKFNGVPNIVQVYAYFEENGTAYLVMEYLHGINLKKYLNDIQKKMPWQDAIEIIAPVIEAVNVIHSAGILHRDIAPDNIMLCPGGDIKLESCKDSNGVSVYSSFSVKVIDFGAARLSDIELERTRSIILKPGYAPPEQYTKKSLQGPWTDVYAIAATLYRMVTGIIPEESVNRIIEDNLRAPLEFDPSIPENLSNAIMKGMALRRELRIKDTDEFMSAVFGEKEVMEPNAELRKRRRRRTLTVSTAVLVLICMGIAVYFLYRDKKAETDLNPADITMWLAVSDYEDTEALREMMDSAMADFRENQSRVNVDVEFIKDDEYAERLEEAYSNGEMPTLYDAEYASEEIQDKAADVSRTFEDLSSDSYYLLFENKEKLIEDKVVPLSFRAPVLYVKRSPDVQDIDSLVITDYSQISELSDGQFYISDDSLGMIMSTLDSQDKIKIYKAKYDAKWQSFTGNEIINEFHDDDNMLYYYDTTDVYDTVNKNLVGLYQVVEIDADSIYVEFTNEMSVYGEATRDEENAAVLFLSFLLQPDAQDEMFLGKDSITGLPLAKRTMNQYTDDNGEMKILNDYVGKMKLYQGE